MREDPLAPALIAGCRSGLGQPCQASLTLEIETGPISAAAQAEVIK